MTPRRWAVSTHHDLPGDLSAVGLHEAEDADLFDYIRKQLADPDVLSVTVFVKEDKASILRQLRHQSDAVCLHANQTVN